MGPAREHKSQELRCLAHLNLRRIVEFLRFGAYAGTLTTRRA